MLPYLPSQNIRLPYWRKVLSVSPIPPIGYWPLSDFGTTAAIDESANGRTGAYTAATLGQPGIGDGRMSAGFDGASSFANIYSASFNGAFTPAEGTVLVWAKVVNAGVWSDATTRRAVTIRADASNYVTLIKQATTNRFDWQYSAGGVLSIVNNSSMSGQTGFLSVALTWSKGNDQMKAYLNGVQQGATQTGLGVWVGALNAANTVIGALSTTPANPWSGTIAHVAVWDSALSAAQIATLAMVP